MCGGKKPAPTPAPKPDPTIASRGSDSAANASGGITNAKGPVATSAGGTLGGESTGGPTSSVLGGQAMCGGGGGGSNKSPNGTGGNGYGLGTPGTDTKTVATPSRRAAALAESTAADTTGTSNTFGSELGGSNTASTTGAL